MDFVASARWAMLTPDLSDFQVSANSFRSSQEILDLSRLNSATAYVRLDANIVFKLAELRGTSLPFAGA